MTFKIRPGIKFHSGNPLTAQDVAYSLQRVVKLNLSPGFILTQFGFTPENMAETIKATDDSTLVLDPRQALRADLPALLPDRRRRRRWSTRSWPWSTRRTATWATSGSRPTPPAPARSSCAPGSPTRACRSTPTPTTGWARPSSSAIVTRHIAEPATQRLLLEKGDIDIARKLSPEDLAAVAANPDDHDHQVAQGCDLVHGPEPEEPEPRQARGPRGDEVSGRLRRASSNIILKGKAQIHQAFLPEGFLGAIADTPYKLDVAKAKELLAKAGLPDGFKVTMDTRNNSPTKDIAQAIQATMAQAGIEIEIIPADNKQTLTKYRARQHDIYIGQWGPDYQDPHTNAETFAMNVDNKDDAKSKTLAWRNAWDIPEMTAETQAAVLERDAASAPPPTRRSSASTSRSRRS